MRTIATIGLSLFLAAACSGAPDPAPTASAPAGSPGATSPGTPTGTPATVPSPAQPTPAQSPGASGVTGPVFTGTLDQAIPPVIAGQQVQVFGPVSAPEMENLDANTLALIEQLQLDPNDVEVVFATDSGSSVIIFAMRFPGIDATTLDSSYLAIQEAAPGTSNFRVVTVAGRNVRAYDTLIGTQYAWVNGDILFTVFGGDEGAQQAIAAMPLPTVALQAGGEVLADALVEVILTGGEHAGTYHGETSSGGCSRNALGENQFGLQYSDDQNADGFTSLQLVVEDESAAAAEAGGTDDFFATFQIGPMFGGTSYSLRPADADGEGTVTITSPSPDSATVVISGETADGVGIEATVTCNVVFDFGGG